MQRKMEAMLHSGTRQHTHGSRRAWARLLAGAMLLGASVLASAWAHNPDDATQAPTKMDAAGATDQAPAPLKTLKLGVFAYRPKPLVEDRFAQLGTYLGNALPGHTVQVLAMSNDELHAAIGKGELDFVLTNPTHFIRLRQYNSLSGALTTMVLRDGDAVVHGIGGVMVRRAEREDIQTLKDLKNKRVAYAGRDYLGTYMAPAAELARAGVDLGTITWVEANQPVDRVITAVLEGAADVGFARTGILEDLEREGKLHPGQLAVINPQAHPGFPYRASTRLYPEWPFLAAAHVEPAVTHRVASALLNMSPQDPAAKAAGIYGFTIPADYSSVETAMRELRMSPFDLPVTTDWSAMWSNHKAWILALSAATLSALLLAMRLGANNRRLQMTRDSLIDERQELQEISARMAFLLEASPVVIYTLVLKNGNLTHGWVSGNITRVMGYTPQQALVPNWWIRNVHPEDRQKALEQQGLLASSGRIEHTYRMADASSNYHWIQDEIRLLKSRPGHMEAVGFWRDISGLKRQEDSLRLAASVFDNSYDGVIIADGDGSILDVNGAFTRITGYSEPEALWSNLSMLAHDPGDNSLFIDMFATARARGHWQGELLAARKDHSSFPCMMSVSAVSHSSMPNGQFVAVFSDISHIKKHQAELDRLAHFDPLTGVPNRRLLADRLTQAVARSKRTGKALAVCYLDLDDFKQVNDRLGHALGDQLLQKITQRLQHVLRGDDTLARLGGDEFVLLLTELTLPEEWQTVLGRVLHEVQQPVDLGNQTAKVSASLGVTLFPADHVDPDTLLRHADQAMYRAKQKGRNQYQLFDLEQDREVQVRQEQLVRMEQALAQREFVLHYQPKVDLQSGDVVGTEALIRWNHPQQGVLAPGAFLWQMEGSPLEVDVGEWVIDTALVQLEEWKRIPGMLCPKACMSVNLSGRQLLKPGFSSWLAAALERHPEVEAHQLELEILESAAIADMETAARVMRECRSLGVRFALDDFGTGYSSLAYFRTLPVDIIKIDQSFVRDMLTDPDDQGIVESVIYLAHAFHRPVIAEGVETMQHAATLLRLGCHLVQGYGIARPMPAHEFPAWIQRWKDDRAWETLAPPT